MIADLCFKVGSVESAIALVKELDLSAIHAFAYRLDELRRDPKERKKIELTEWFHREWEQEAGNKELLSEALGL